MSEMADLAVPRSGLIDIFIDGVPVCYFVLQRIDRRDDGKIAMR